MVLYSLLVVRKFYRFNYQDKEQVCYRKIASMKLKKRFLPIILDENTLWEDTGSEKVTCERAVIND